jgi:Tfp pilus assembly protein PilN
MSLIYTLLVVWGVVTTVLVILLIYRSTLSIHEDNQLFIDQSESHMEKEQTALLIRMKKLQMPLRLLGSASVLLILIVFGIWLWRGLNQM